LMIKKIFNSKRFKSKSEGHSQGGNGVEKQNINY